MLFYTIIFSRCHYISPKTGFITEPVYAFYDKNSITKNSKKKLIEELEKVTLIKQIELKKPIINVYAKPVTKLLKVRLADENIYWIPGDYFTENPFIIIKNKIEAYYQPDKTSKILFYLSPGDFGYHVQTMKKNWYLVNFTAYHIPAYSSGKKKIKVGKVWINRGYSNNIRLARQAYYLEKAKIAIKYKYKNYIQKAQVYLKRVLEIGDSNSIISNIAKKMLQDLII